MFSEDKNTSEDLCVDNSEKKLDRKGLAFK